MLQLENAPEADLMQHSIQVDGYDEQTILRHLEILHDSGFIQAKLLRAGSGPHRLVHGRVEKIMPPGYDFIDAAKSDTFWAKAKQRAGSSFRVIPLPVLRELLIAVAKESLGLR